MTGLATEPLEYNDFSGGITDFYRAGPINKYRYADNFLITVNKKLYTRPGSELYDEDALQIPAGAQRINALIPFGDELFVTSAKKLYYFNSGYSTLQGLSSNDVFNLGDAQSNVSFGVWNKHLLVGNDAFATPMKIYRDGASALKVRNAGLPDLASSPTVTAGGAGAQSYIYAFLYYYTYTVGTVTYEDFGPITRVQLSAALAPDASTVAITLIPTLANGVTDNYDTTDIKVKIYRTTTGGKVYYYVGQVNNGTATYNDSMSDTTLQTAATLYTTEGRLQNDPAPKCKYVHVVQNYAYYGHTKDGSVVYKNRLRHSHKNDIDGCPEEFYDDYDEEILGVSSYNFTPIVFCTDAVYRVDGNYEADGTGGMSHQRIGDKVVLASNKSVVITPSGTFFAALDGFYFTDSYNVLKISDFNTRYATLIANEPDRICGTYDPINRLVLFGVQADSSVGENDSIYVLDLKWGIRPDSTFTTWSGGTSFRPTALAYFGGQILRADSRGYLFKHDSTLYTDPRVDTGVTATSWGVKTIMYRYESCSTNFGTTFFRKMVPRIVVTATKEANMALQVNSINDGKNLEAPLKLIRYSGNFTWGDPDAVWGDATYEWNPSGMVEEERRFPARNLRCSYKSIVMENAYVTITTSAREGTATVSAAAKTAVLVDASTYNWPALALDYYISFEDDDYDTQFLITVRGNDSLTFADTGNECPNGVQNWKIKGYPKNEILNLVGYCLEWAVLGKTQKPYRGET